MFYIILYNSFTLISILSVSCSIHWASESRAIWQLQRIFILFLANKFRSKLRLPTKFLHNLNCSLLLVLCVLSFPQFFSVFHNFLALWCIANSICGSRQLQCWFWFWIWIWIELFSLIGGSTHRATQIDEGHKVRGRIREREREGEREGMKSRPISGCHNDKRGPSTANCCGSSSRSRLSQCNSANGVNGLDLDSRLKTQDSVSDWSQLQLHGKYQNQLAQKLFLCGFSFLFARVVQLILPTLLRRFYNHCPAVYCVFLSLTLLNDANW